MKPTPPQKASCKNAMRVLATAGISLTLVMGAAAPAHAFWPGHEAQTTFSRGVLGRVLQSNLHEAQGDFPAIPAAATVRGVSQDGAYVAYISTTGHNNNGRHARIWVLDAHSNEILAYMSSTRFQTSQYYRVGDFVVRANVQGNTGFVVTVGDIFGERRSEDSEFPAVPHGFAVRGRNLVDNTPYIPYFVWTGGQTGNPGRMQVWVVNTITDQVVFHADGPESNRVNLRDHTSFDRFDVSWQITANSINQTGNNHPRIDYVRVPTVGEVVPPGADPAEDDYKYDGEYEEVYVPFIPEIDWSNVLPMPLPTFPTLPPVAEVDDEEYEEVYVPYIPEIDWSNVLPMPLPTLPTLPPVAEVDDEEYEYVYEEDVYELEEETVELPEVGAPGQCGIGIAGEFAAWNAASVFNTGDRVTFDGRLFEAQWWTQNDTPGANVHGSWMEIAAITLNGELVDCWTASRVFNTGDVVYFDGNVFQAQWFTRNEQPGVNPWGAWMQLSTTDNVEATVTPDPAHDVWTADRVFTGGETVYFDGYLWSAQWWTRNQVPGADAHGPWRNLGRA